MTRFEFGYNFPSCRFVFGHHSPIHAKSRDFAFRIIGCYKFLVEEKKDMVMSNNSAMVPALALTERLLAEQDKTKVQNAMVRDSLTRAFDELRSGKVNHDAHKLFAE